VIVPGRNLFRDKVVDDLVTITEAYVFYNLPKVTIGENVAGSILGVATQDGTASVSYFGDTLDEYRTAMESLKEGDYVTFSGKVNVSLGGDQARAKHLVINAAPVVIPFPSWNFDGFESARTVEMKDGFQSFANTLGVNDLGVMYSFTNVEFRSIVSSSSTSTNYDYLNYTSLVTNKNEVVAGTSITDYIRLGVYKFALDSSMFNTTSVFTIQAFLVGSNQNVPFSGGSNPILRLSGFVKVISSVPILPTSLSIGSPGNVTTLIETTKLQLTATVLPANAANKTVTWSSNAPSVATVSSTGEVTGIAAGNVTIKAISDAVNTVENTIDLIVTAKIGVVSITISSLDNVTSLASNGQLQLTASVLPADAFDKTVTWSSSDITIATVSATGLVSGVAEGNVTISATSAEIGSTAVGTINLTVADPIVISSIDISSLSNDVVVGKTLQLTLTPTPSNWFGTYTFTSTDETKATVNETGLVSGVGLGSVTITATSVETPSIFDTIDLSIIVETSLYSTGFESSEFFTASTAYNNTVEALRGPAGKQWAFYYGTPSTTGPLAGLQSAQMRYYTASPNDFGYTRTAFDTADVNYLTFIASSSASSMSVIVSISKDGGTTWIDNQTFALTTAIGNFKYIVPTSSVSGNTRFKFQLTGTSLVNSQRFNLDNINMVKIER
jgi:uncharacterized protein YjdB